MRYPGYLAPEELSFVDGDPPARGIIRHGAGDFVVDEELAVSPSGHGQHVWLHLRKTNLTTLEVVTALRKTLQLKRTAIGYAGLKDRRAVTSQWLSVDLAGRQAPEWHDVLPDGAELLAAIPHDRKLRHAVMQANRFRIVIRSISGDRGDLESRLRRIALSGMPNYFGPQRFGRNGANIAEAYRMLVDGRRIRDRDRAGLYLSAARSLLFNRVLSERVTAGVWDQAMNGDVMMLDGSHSHFVAADITDDLRSRTRAHAIHPTGPLWGAGPSATESLALVIEQQALVGCEPWCQGLAAARLNQQRRSLRARPWAFHHQFHDDQVLELHFALPAGVYATTVLREVLSF